MKVLEYFFNCPEEWIHIRALGRKLHKSPNTIRAEITLLLKQKLIVEKKDSVYRLFKANLETQKFINLKKIDNLKKILETKLVEEIYKYYSPKAIILFGSYSRGEDLSNSDIDIGVITAKKGRVVLDKYEKKLSREIRLSLFLPSAVSEEFYNNILNGIVLKGQVKNEKF